MAYSTAYLPSSRATDPCRHFFYADTAAELAGITEKIQSDMAYAFDTKLFYSYNGTIWNGAQLLSEKGAANGYAGLDAGGFVPLVNLPGLPAAWGAITGLISAQTDLKLNTVAVPTGSVDFNKQQAVNIVLENRTDQPASPATGQMIFRTDL